MRQELEATLAPPAAGPAAARGKAEWKVYADGTRQGRVSASGLDLPDGAVVEIGIGERMIGTTAVEGGRVRYRRESGEAEVVPEVAVGEVLRLRHTGRVLLEGAFYAE